MQKLKKDAAPGGGPAAAPSAQAKALGILGDAVLLSLAGVVGFSGYYTWAYKDTAELEKMLHDAAQPPAPAPPPPSSPPTKPSGPPSPPSAPAGTAAASTSSTGGAPEGASAGPGPLTTAWCFAMSRYLAARMAIEQQVHSYTAPTYHKLLPDMAPELKGRCVRTAHTVRMRACVRARAIARGRPGQRAKL